MYAYNTGFVLTKCCLQNNVKEQTVYMFGNPLLYKSGVFMCLVACTVCAANHVVLCWKLDYAPVLSVTSVLE